MTRIVLLTAAAFILAACAETQTVAQTDAMTSEPTAQVAAVVSGPQAPYIPDAPEGFETAIFAGGCFWCVEKDFESVPGVLEVISGYSGGTLDNPDYRTVSYTETGHYEAAEVIYDPKVVSYRELVDYFWTTVDPTDDRGQFCDKGSSYRTAIFAMPEQRGDAEASLASVTANKPFSDPIVTPILPAVTFYNAEDYHQDYYRKNPVRYRLYRTNCRRDARLKDLWGDGAKAIPQ